MANPNPSGPSGAQAAKPSSGKRSSSSGRKTYAEAYKNADKSKYKTLADFTVAAKAYNAKKANKSSNTGSKNNTSTPKASSTVPTQEQSVQSSQKKDNMTTGVIAPKPTGNKTTEKTNTEKTKPRTVKQVRQEARSERKSIRKANREERRAPRKARRLANVEARQEKRTNRVEKNQTRKTNNAAKREEKRANKGKISLDVRKPDLSISSNTGRVRSQNSLANAESRIKKGNELMANNALQSDLNKTAFAMKDTPMKFMQNQQGVQGTPYQDVNQMNYNFDPLSQQRAKQMQMPNQQSPMFKKDFPDLNKDGKITKADILIGRGVKK